MLSEAKHLLVNYREKQILRCAQNDTLLKACQKNKNLRPCNAGFSVTCDLGCGYAALRYNRMPQCFSLL